jgi:hypothetical protein
VIKSDIAVLLSVSIVRQEHATLAHRLVLKERNLRRSRRPREACREQRILITNYMAFGFEMLITYLQNPTDENIYKASN